MADRDDRNETGGPLYSSLLALLVLALLVGFAVLPRFFRPYAGPLAGKDAPAFTLDVVANAPDPTKGKIALEEYRGHPVLLDFWATWCGPCQLEAPIVDRIAQRLKDRGLVVVGVNTQDAPGAARAWVQRKGLSYPIVYDAGDHAARAYGIDALPTLVLVSKTGKVVRMHTGMIDEEPLEEMIAGEL